MNIFKFKAKTMVLQHIMRVLLGLALAYAGVSHLTFNREEFLAQVPRWVPLDPDLVVILSGIVEIILGLGLIFFISQKVFFGLVTGIFFILIFPGNLAQYHNEVDAFGLDSDRARLIRLFFQPLLVLWAIWSTGAWQYLKSLKKKQSNGTT
ncbi:DoxX family protein [Arthrospiribacter ruber]|uniref:DoxX family membrane protein n=1 Tax=Arthrospiribacter ruber TaxID=2487934 RepID=A0A951IWA5_9BACT|nr:DoxX family membrane protein [Arthrospiribacter ruber]MBW3467252.1 DoxX family membrane protein [Arthrospiribacter ruber]